jgi:hypothetical protein
MEFDPMNISDVTRAVDAKDAAQQALREMLALIEETSNYIAKATRGITTATPERRKLREEMERSLSHFLSATASPDAARAYTIQPEATVSLMLSQSMTASAPTEPKIEVMPFARPGSPDTRPVATVAT